VLRPRETFLLVPFALGLFVDQASKAWARGLAVVTDEVQLVPGWLSLVHAQNIGAAFSTLPGFRWMFVGFTAVAVAVMLQIASTRPRSERLLPAILGVIISGAVGNGLDRIRLGHVTDFIKVTVGHDGLAQGMVALTGSRVWPIFNVADIALVVGVAAFVVHYVWLDPTVEPPEGAAHAPPDGEGPATSDEGGPGPEVG